MKNSKYENKYLQKKINGLSGGERIMLKFIKGVWTGKGTLLLGDIKRLDTKHRNLIADWIKNPFYSGSEIKK